MKKFLSSLLALLLSIILILPPDSSVKANIAGTAPVELKGVTYKLKTGVLQLPANISPLFDKDKRIFTLDKSADDFKPNIGQIYVDTQKASAAKIKSLETDEKGRRIIKTDYPQLNEVLEDFNIPLQTVKPTSGNVKVYKDGVSLISKPVAAAYSISTVSTKSSALADTGGEIHRFELRDVMLINEGDKSSGNYIQLKVNGFLEFQLPTITAQGNLANFQVDLNAYEKSEIAVHLEGKIKKDHDFLIAGYTIPFGIGNADLGIYLHYKVDGEITVDVKVEQGVSFNTGITGKYDFPFSYDFGSHFNSDNYFKFTSSIQGKLSATAGIAAKCGLKVFDTNLGGLRAEFGVNAKASINNTNVDVSVNAFLDAKAKVIGHDYSIYNKEWKIYESHEKYTAGYTIALTEADAYSNRISGDATKDNNPYTGKVAITVKRGTSVLLNNFKVACNSDGKFILIYAGLRPNDIITAKIDIPSPVVSTNSVKASVPFDKIEIKSADAFNDRIKGHTAGNYTGIVTITVESPESQPSSSPNTNSKPKIVSKSYSINCTNGEFQYNTPLTGHDKVYARLSFEGLTVTSQKIIPNLALNIYITVDKNGIKGTLQNMEGVKVYTGKVIILSKPIPTKPAVRVGEVNAVSYGAPVPISNQPSWGNINPNINLDLTNQTSLSRARHLSIGPFGSSHFQYEKLKAPDKLTNIPWSVYARIEYEGASVQGTYTISLLTLIQNISSDSVIINFNQEMLSDKSLLKIK